MSGYSQCHRPASAAPDKQEKLDQALDSIRQKYGQPRKHPGWRFGKYAALAAIFPL